MKHIFLGVLVAMLAYWVQRVAAQPAVGYGDWQLHLPTNHPLRLADAGNRVYVVTENALYFLDKTLNTTQTLSRRDGLSDVGVAAVAYDSVGQQTVVAYRNGNLDFIQRNGRVRNLADVARRQVQGVRTIYELKVAGRRAYMATGFGLVTINLDRLEISDTYSNIGVGGAAVRVYSSVVSHDTLFVATATHLQYATIRSNLLDYRAWSRDAQGLAGLRQLVTFRGNVVAAPTGGNLYVFRRSLGRWTDLFGTYSGNFTSIRATPQGLLMAGRDYLNAGFGVKRISWPPVRDQVTLTSVVPAVATDLVTDFVPTGNGALFVASYDAGVELVESTGTSRVKYEANGPERPLAFGVLADGSSGKVDVFSGGFSNSYVPFGYRLGFYEYEAGRWTNFSSKQSSAAEYPNPQDPVRGTRTPDGTLYVATYGNGVLEWKGPGQFRTLDENTPGSPIRRRGGPGSAAVTDVAADANGQVWVVNFHQQANVSGLYRFNPADASWYVVPFFGTGSDGSHLLDRIALDDVGQVWVSASRKSSQGVWCVDPATGTAKRFTEGLSNKEVYDMAKDRRGDIWVATLQGVSVLNDPSGALTGTSSFRVPIVRRGDGTGFPALFTDAVKAVAVDGGNRKWFGTDNGLWLFSEDADEALLHFTTANSPLPSNRITDVDINQKTGEVWVATDAGVVSYRGGASVTEGSPSCAQAFPNPVRPEFAGLVGITGVSNNAQVKITDVAGHLVYSTKASGGTVTWNLNDVNGRRVRTGVYLVLTADAEGKNGCVTKVAVLSE